MALQRALATVREAPFIVDVLQAADDLALAATRDGSRRAADLLAAAAQDPDDELTAIAAVHALGRVFDDRADAVLSDLLSHDRAFLREHAAWTLAARLPRLDAIGRLIAVLSAGGFSGMLAQRTLGQWSRAASDHVALALEGALAVERHIPARAGLVETLGLVPGQLAGPSLLRIAADSREDDAVRVVALSALGDREPHPHVVDLLRQLSRGAGDVAQGARLAAIDLDLRPAGSSPVATSTRGGGLRIAQLFLHADIDRELSRAGMGDNGGVATLLLRLGDALAADPRIEQVLTLSRGTVQAAAEALSGSGSIVPEAGHVLVPVPLLRPPTGSAQAWPARVAAERGIRRMLRAAGPIDVLHLRMGDVGSLAADTVARQLGIPVVFTLAPDPHAVIHSLDMTGALTRAGFGAGDEQEHYWFRARLVQRLAATSAHNVLFPRPELEHDLRELLGIEVREEPHRYTVVPEGIDLALSRAAGSEVAARRSGDRPAAGSGGVAAEQLERLLAALPAHRRGLPLAVSVGRLHRVKGMAAVVEAWAGDEQLRDRCNLLVVGGDLARPSSDEREQLELIDQVVPSSAQAEAGLILAGHRPNDVVAQWLALARLGSTSAAGDGIYVCGSLKEEFGLAVLEALAAGLVVVAPNGGGPATYVEQGVTGLLVDTRDPAALAAGMRAALVRAGEPDREQRAARARALIEQRLTVQAMATTLAGIYAGVRRPAARR